MSEEDQLKTTASSPPPTLLLPDGLGGDRILMRGQSLDMAGYGHHRGVGVGVGAGAGSRIPESDPLEFFSPTLGPEGSFDDDEDDILTPLVSPALTPSQRGQQVAMEEEASFSMLSEPALALEPAYSSHPAMYDPGYRAQMPPAAYANISNTLGVIPAGPPPPRPKKAPSKRTRTASSGGQELMPSPRLGPQGMSQLSPALIPMPKGFAARPSPKLSPMLSPAMTPSMVMGIRSPSLLPVSKDNRILTEDQIVALQSKSNYQNLIEGSAE